MSQILLSAHSGGPEGCYKPNTIEAALSIRDSGVDLIEFDVRVTKDRKLVVYHDNKVQINNRYININKLTLKELRKFSKDICTLKQMLEVIKDHCVAHVDIKSKSMVIETIDECISVLGLKNFIVTTSFVSSVKKIRKKRPNVDVALTIGRDTQRMHLKSKILTELEDYIPFGRIKSCEPTKLAICYKEATPWTIHWAKKHNLPVLLWTVDGADLTKKTWDSKNIWAFTTNYPRAALGLKHSR